MPPPTHTPPPHPHLPYPLLTLLTANFIPLLGVLAFDWNASEIIALYYLESAIVGVFTILRIAASRAPDANLRAKLFLAPFFCVHFGLFMVVHGVFVAMIIGGLSIDVSIDPRANLLAVARHAAGTSFWFAFAGLALSHATSLALNYFGDREFERVPLSQWMIAPYSRIVVMHVVVLFGTLLVVALNQPILLVVLLVVVKTTVDARAHLSEHRRHGSR